MKDKTDVLGEYNRRIGQQIKKVREANSETQQDLADKLGYSKTHIGAIESGRRRVTIDMLVRMQEHYHISVDDLFSEIPVSYAWNTEKNRYLDKAEELSEEHQKMVKEMIKVMWLSDHPGEKFE